jgi:hypothetical protein
MVITAELSGLPPPAVKAQPEQAREAEQSCGGFGWLVLVAPRAAGSGIPLQARVGEALPQTPRLLSA